MNSSHGIMIYIMTHYKDLFSYSDEKLYLSDPLKFIFPTEIEVEYDSSYVNIVPCGHVYNFRLFIPNLVMHKYNREKEIYVSGEIESVIPDDVCLLLYKYDIDIYHNVDDDGNYILYDRVAIERRHTLKGLLS